MRLLFKNLFRRLAFFTISSLSMHAVVLLLLHIKSRLEVILSMSYKTSYETLCSRVALQRCKRRPCIQERERERVRERHHRIENSPTAFDTSLGYVLHFSLCLSFCLFGEGDAQNYDLSACV